MLNRKEKIGLILITISAIITLIGLLIQDPIPQDPAYHNFADKNDAYNIPNILNVLSNLPFLIVGLLGLYYLSIKKTLNIVTLNTSAYFALFIGTALVSFGSGYYHLWPDNQTLVWDRLPMTIAFMGLFSIVISEFISMKIGKLLLIPLLILGVMSVLYWHITESNGYGDLRYYAMVQFFPILAIPIILFAFKSRFSNINAYWWLLTFYIAAKLFEHYDFEVQEQLSIISGHSIKHIAAAIGLYILLRAYENRKELT